LDSFLIVKEILETLVLSRFEWFWNERVISISNYLF